MKDLSALWPNIAKLWIHTPLHWLFWVSRLRWVPNSKGSPNAEDAWVTTQPNIWVLLWEDNPKRCLRSIHPNAVKSGITGQLVAPKHSRFGFLLSRRAFAQGGTTWFEGASFPRPLIRIYQTPLLSRTWRPSSMHRRPRTGRQEKLRNMRQNTAVPNESPVTTQRQLGKSAKPKLENSNPTYLEVPQHSMQSHLERISDFHGNFFLAPVWSWPVN